MPFFSRVAIMSSIGCTYLVARGSMSGRSNLSRPVSAWNASTSRSVIASIGSLRSRARSMILSSMSVMLRTYLTSKPVARSQRTTMSNVVKVRALPMWMKSYTVGPQTYIPA
jgi:hypothetical protein